MNIGKPKRIIEITPTKIPVPEKAPAPVPEREPVHVGRAAHRKQPHEGALR